MTASPDPAELEPLLTTILERTGLDFRDYARSSLRRRVARQRSLEGLATVAELRERVAADPEALGRLVSGITVHVTA
ncbi:MAG TPA: hypothetical protein VFE31_05875, partial [Opitutaceae bacterium]|nr:hypothetical protein [Opitutaceae bacterium]